MAASRDTGRTPRWHRRRLGFSLARSRLDEQVALVLATGSTGTARWRDGWSDLDLLVVRDTVALDWLRRTIGTLHTRDGIKVGVSTFTTSDIDALRVPPRVVQSLRRAAQSRHFLAWTAAP